MMDNICSIFCVVAGLCLLASCSGTDGSSDADTLVVTAFDAGSDGAAASSDALKLDAAVDGSAGDIELADGQQAQDAAASDATTADAANAGDSTDSPDSGALDDATGTADAPGTSEGDTTSPQDIAGNDAGAPPSVGVGSLYCHSSNTLYRLDLASKKFALVGKFKFNKSGGSVTDIALDKNGQLYAITFNSLHVCNELTAACTFLAKLPQNFNGLTFVPYGTVDKNDEALIGISNTGDWNHIKVTGTKATIKKLGSYGNGWQSSGDAFSVEKIGTFATVTKGLAGDSLVKVDPKTGKVLKVIGATTAKSLWGLAWWQGVFYGFSSNGVVYTIDEKTGASKPVSGIVVPKGVSWWGAGVSTRAAGGF